MNQEETIQEIEELQRQGKIIVTTNGSFDIMHSAHVHILEKAKALGDVLIVLLNSDASISRNKGPKRPIIPQEERKKMLLALKPVDYVLIFEEDTPLNMLSMIKPNFHVKGGSYIPERAKAEKDLVETWGGQCVYYDLEQGFSTTNIIERIRERYG